MNSIVIAPTFLKPSCAVGQIERHFFPNLPKEYYSHIICAEDDLKIEGDRFRTHIVPERKSVLKLDLLFRKLGWRDLVYSPDITYYSWCRRAFKEASKLIENERINYIHTINNPVSAHLVGYRLKMKYGIPWIAQFYDPWYNNPVRKYCFDYFKKKDYEREKLLAEYADIILFPNYELLNAFNDLYGNIINGSMAVIPFITEIPCRNTLTTFPNKCMNDVLTISHIGTLSADRRADVFLLALANLKQRIPELKLMVNFVGNMYSEDLKIIKELNLQSIVNVVGKVSESECQSYYENSDLFMIIDMNFRPNLFYPSKLLKYFCYGKPIFGIADKDSVVAHELVKTKNRVFRFEDIDGISSFIEQAVTDYSSICVNDIDYGSKFKTDNVIKQYVNLIEKI